MYVFSRQHTVADKGVVRVDCHYHHYQEQKPNYVVKLHLLTNRRHSSDLFSDSHRKQKAQMRLNCLWNGVVCRHREIREGLLLLTRI